jgi:hypothetical protein
MSCVLGGADVLSVALVVVGAGLGTRLCELFGLCGGCVVWVSAVAVLTVGAALVEGDVVAVGLVVDVVCVVIVLRIGPLGDCGAGRWGREGGGRMGGRVREHGAPGVWVRDSGAGPAARAPRAARSSW